MRRSVHHRSTRLFFELLENRTLLSSASGSILGQVFNDADGNGRKSSSENGIANVTVYLDANNNGKLDSGETKTTTNSSGNYSFTDLKAGTYLVRQILPGGMKQTTPAKNYANHVMIKTGQKATNELFGDEKTVSGPPSVSINDVAKNEGNSGTTQFTFMLTRSGNTAGPSIVSYVTANGTATSSSDYTAASGKITFAAGQTSQTITVDVKGDTTVESNETFFVNLTAVSNVSLADAQGMGTILNDDAPAYPPPGPAGAAPDWAGYAGNAQHTALSTATVASQDLDKLKWSVSVDLKPVIDSDGDLYAHYGSPLITAANTVIVPVKTASSGAYRVQAVNGSDGSTLWQMSTDYILPPHDWIPDFDPTVTASGRVFFAGAGGTIDWRDDADSATGASGQIAFYGTSNYLANKSKMDSTVFVDTPITADSAGNIYFGIQVTGSNPMNLKSGLVRIAVDGTGTYVSAVSAANNDSSIDKPAQNAAPAISNDGKTVYFVVNHTSGSDFDQAGDVLALDATTLKTIAVRKLLDPVDQSRASVPDDATASPMIGPDGDVYFGVLTSDSDLRGFMLHFSGDLATTKTPGSFGWDDTASVVPASMVSSYHGSSSYLILTKYNNYVEGGGDGINKLAILDPNATQTDPLNNIPVMKEVLTIAGVTPDPEFPDTPGAVREWCINTAAIDPLTDSVLANSEDGKLYRWDLSTNTLSQKIVLNGGQGESYTPTAIGPDGTVYSINDSTLWAVGI